MAITSDGGQFSLTLEWQPGVASELRIDYAGPIDFSGYQCSAQSGPNGTFKEIRSAADVRTTVPTGGSFMLGCSRPAGTKSRDGESFTCYKETLINVATNGPTAVLKIPETCTPSMPGARASAIEQRIAMLENTAKSNSMALAALSPQPTNANGNYCTTMGTLQVCWGTAVLTPNSAAPHTASFSFTFPIQFGSTPTVTNGININGSGHNAGVYSYTLTDQVYHGSLNNIFAGTPINGVITMNYIAIGTARR